MATVPESDLPATAELRHDGTRYRLRRNYAPAKARVPRHAGYDDDVRIDADQRAPLGRGGGDDGAEDLAAAAYDRYRQKHAADDAAAAAGADADAGSGIAAAKTELLMLVILFAAVAATAVGVAAFFAARRLKGRVRSPSHFAPVVGAACDVELADARPVDQTFDELATVEAVRVSDAAPPELAVAKAAPDGATEKML